MPENSSVIILETGAFDQGFRALASDNPRLAGKLLSKIEAFAVSGSGDHSVIKTAEAGNLVQLRSNGYRVVMFVDEPKNEIYVIGLVRENDANLDVLKNLSAISMLTSALRV